MADTAKTLVRFIAKTRQQGDCLVWTGGKFKSGYGTFHLDGRTQSAHRVSYMLHKGAIPDGLVVMHSCDNRLCVNPDHLSLGTMRDNSLDMTIKGRGNKAEGVNHPLAKATPEIVEEIRRRYKPYCRINGSSALAREFDLAQPTVHTIIRGETWRQKR